MSETSSTIGSKGGEQRGAPYIVYRVRLTDEQLSYLRTRYPGYEFRPGRVQTGHDHPVSHMIRTIENREITADPSLRYVDIGGKPCRYLDRPKTSVHCCMPILSGEDEVRQSKLRVPDNVTVCHNKGEDCKVPADCLVSVDVLYFQDPDSVAECMLSHGCNSYLASVNNVFDGSGYLNNCEVYYEVNNEELVQTNIETGNSYVHRSLDWIWSLNNHLYKGKYLNAEIVQRSPDRVRICFTLTKHPNLVKRNIDLHKYTSLTFTTWRNNYTGSRTYCVDGKRHVAYDHDIVHHLVTKHLNTRLEELAPQLLTEIKNVQLRGYHCGAVRRYVHIPNDMFKVYVLIAKETILNERLNLHLADRTLDELAEACRTADQHRETIVNRFRKYLTSWYLFKETSKPDQAPSLEVDLWQNRTPELLRAHTVEEPDDSVTVKQTHFDVPVNNDKEEYRADDGIKLIGPQPAGPTLYVPTQNMEELRIAMKTRADRVPDNGREEHHHSRMAIFRRWILRARQFDDICWSYGRFLLWVAKFEPAKRQRYIDVVRARLEGVQDNLDAMRPSDRELLIRDLFVKMEALYKIHDEGTEIEVKPRLIISSNEMVNLYYGPIVDEVKKRFKDLLAKCPLKLVYTDGNTPQDNADLFHKAYRDGSQIAENDFSKYDSTQGKWVKETEFAIYEALGLRHTDLATWRRTTRCSYTSRKYGFKAQVPYQRQTGDPTTSLGNSIINLMTSLDAYHRAGIDLLDIDLMMVLGDDNLAVFPPGTITDDRHSAIEQHYSDCGLKAKYKVVFDPHKAEYCSTVFINTGDRFAACPKPGKALARLNVRSKFHPSVSDEHYIESKRFSFWLANCNNPLGRTIADLYAKASLLERAMSAKAYNVYETQRLQRMFLDRGRIPHVSDAAFAAFCQDRYGSMNVFGTCMVLREMCISNDVTTIELDDLTKQMVAIDQ